MDAILSPSRRALRLIALTLLQFLPAAPGLAQVVSEPAVKAAFLYKFVGYVEWPAATFSSPDSPYVIGVMGAEEVAVELERLVDGRVVNGRRVVARRMKEGQGAAGVHMLFLGRTESRAREVLRALQRQPVLTVTDADNGLEQGSAVALLLLGDRVGFEVSTAAAERGGLAISSRMLSVARRVVTGGE